MSTATQLDLFSIENNVATPVYIQKASKGSDFLRKVSLGMISIRPDKFNARVKPSTITEEAWNDILKVPELADGIYERCGPAEPILGDFHKDGHFYITNGERRYRALKHLIATERYIYPNGEVVTDVLVLCNPPGTTDFSRRLKMYDTNDTMPFTPMQRAYYYLSFTLAPSHLSQVQVAELFKISQSKVSIYIIATTLDQETQDKIEAGELSISEAVDNQRKKRSKADDEPIFTGALADKQEKEAKEAEKIRGDEDDFITDDNTKTFSGSRNLPEDQSSGEHTIAKDSVYYLQQQKLAVKQFINRYEHLFSNAKKLILPDLPGDEEHEERACVLFDKRQEHVIGQLINEYDIKVK